jgi:hypothetical protein
MPGAGGRGDLFLNGKQVASGRIDRTIPLFTGTEPADVGDPPLEWNGVG